MSQILRSAASLSPHEESRWLEIFQRRPDANTRLYCFTHVGGTASVYKQWPNFLTEDVEVCAIQLPGREERQQESLCEDIEIVVDRLVEVMLGDARPYLLFGHSFGSILAFAVASRLKRSGREPDVLIVSAKTAPHLPSKKLRSNLPRLQLLQELVAMGGTPQVVLDDTAMMDRILRIVRADYCLLESFKPANYPDLLDCPIVAIEAAQDTYISSWGVDAWREYTHSTFVKHVVSGGHFYIANLTSELFAVINSELEKMTVIL